MSNNDSPGTCSTRDSGHNDNPLSWKDIISKIMCDFEYRMVIFSSTVKIELHLLKLKLKKQKERKQE